MFRIRVRCCPKSSEYGIERTLEYIRAHCSDNAHSIVSGLVEALREFTGNSPQQDDLTAVICKSTSFTIRDSFPVIEA